MEKFDFSELRRVYIPVYVKPFSQTAMKPVQFKVDTGADSTTISKHELYKLGFTLDWIREKSVIETASTADGSVFTVGVVQLPVINLLDYEGKNWPFLVIIDEKRDFRNLLGRDLLSGFNYNFDNDVNVFEIKKANAFHFIGEKLPGQQMHEVMML